MKNEVPLYKSNQITSVREKLSDKNKKLISKFIILCSGTACVEKCQHIERHLIKVADILEKDLDTLDLEDIRAFLGLVNNSKLLPSTRNDMKKFFKRFLKDNYEDWSKRFKDLKDFKFEKEINQEKINANNLINEANAHSLVNGTDSLLYKGVISGLWETATRPETILKTKWEDINWNEKKIKLTSGKTKNTITLLIPNTIEHLARLREEWTFGVPRNKDYVFVNIKSGRGKPISVSALETHLGTLSEKILGRRIYPYLIRHSRLNIMQKILPPLVYQKYADHSLATASKFYNRTNDDDVNQALAKLGKVTMLTKDKQHKLEKEIEILKRDNALFTKAIKILYEKNTTPQEREEDVDRLNKFFGKI